jgi:hypothetical protein
VRHCLAGIPKTEIHRFGCSYRSARFEAKEHVLGKYGFFANRRQPRDARQAPIRNGDRLYLMPDEIPISNAPARFSHPPEALAEMLKRLPHKHRCIQVRVICPSALSPLDRVREIIAVRHGSIKGLLADEDTQLGYSTIVAVFLPKSSQSAAETLLDLDRLGEVTLDP